MRRKVALSLFLVASASVTIPLTLRSSLLQSLEVLVLHVFFLTDVFIRPAVEGVERESPWWALWGKILMLALVYLPLYGGELLARRPWLEGLGISLTAFGAVLALWGRVCLGRMATPTLTIIEKPSLYTEGLYRCIRHPIYTGFSLAFLGHQVTFLFIPGLVVWLLFLVTFIRHRIQVEEDMLLGQFRDGYFEYQKRTWKLFPYVY
jgi:protein-S-isoprenylcysteine O-methyltransferase Ste14